MKRVTALIMSLFLIIATGVNAYATGAEGAILGGLSGGSLAGLGLTGPEVALAVAALFGVAYTVDNADTIYTEMNNCINKVTDGLENQAAVISDWWKEAAAGAVDTTSSVWSGICDWFTGTREQNYNITVGSVQNVKAGEKVNWINYGRGSAYGIASADCRCVEYWYKQGENSRYYFGRMWITYKKNAWITMYYNGHSTNRSIDYNKNYDFYYYNDSDGLTTVSSENWKDTISKYLPNAYYLGQYDFDFSMTVDNLLSLIQPYLGGIQQEKLLGGINKVLDNDLIDSPADVIFPDTIVLNPDAVSNDGLEQILEKVIAGEMTWIDYWEVVTSTSLPAVKSGDAVYELDNEGISEKEADLSPSSSALDDYKLDLTKLFPFCIPFDIYNLLNCLCAEPEAPSFEWVIPLSAVGLEDFKIKIDLKTWDSVAQLVRNMELLAFCIGLAFVTRSLIKG